MIKKLTLCCALLVLLLAGTRLAPVSTAQQTSPDLIDPQSRLLDVPELGVATGGYIDDGVYYPGSRFANGNEQSFKAFAEPIFSEHRVLNAKFIRIEAFRSRPGGSPIPPWVYGRFVQQANALGFKVIVLLIPPSRANRADDDGGDIQTWITEFINDKFRPLLIHAFNSPANRPFAYQVGNEPNTCEDNSLCGPTHGIRGFRIGGNATAAMARQIKEHLVSQGRGEKVVSAGTANTYYNVDGERYWWDRFFGSSAFHEDYNPNNPRKKIFDYMGVHPYNGSKVEVETCINNPKASNCFDNWETIVHDDLLEIRRRVSTASNTLNHELMITEFGWQFPQEGVGADCPKDWRVAHNCVRTDEQMREATQASYDAFLNVGARAAIWHNYRDDANERFGLRSGWDAALNRWPAKSSWFKFRDLAGGSGEPEDTWQIVTCPEGATPPCHKRFSDNYDPTFKGPVEVLARKGYIEGFPVDDGNGVRYPFPWEFKADQIAKRREVARIMVRAYLDQRGCEQRPICGFDLTGAPYFTDVGTEDLDYGHIETARNRYILSGYADRTYRPDNEVTRAQTCKIVVLSMGWELLNPEVPHFTDVPRDHWAYQYIETAFAHGLVTGYPGNIFNPGYSVTRGQLSKIVGLALPTQRPMTFEGGLPEPSYNLAASTLSSTAIEFRWQDAPDAAGFWLDIATSPADLENRTGSFRNYHVGAATRYTWGNLTPGTTYYWRVWTYNNFGGYHSYPEPRSVTTHGQPPTPATNLRATTLSHNSVEFQWDRSPLAAGYWLEAATSANELQNMTGSFRRYHAGAALGLTLENLTPATPYYWRVRAYNNYGETLAYPQPPYVTTLSLLPSPATNLRTTVLGPRSIEFQWNRATGANGYWLDIATSASDLENQTGSFRHYHAGASLGLTLENLTPGTTYYWRVWSYNDHGGVHSYPTPRSVTTPMW